ncbi:hypothetical protein [Rhizobium rhizogenes]|uniref:hypothetical protein n=1 Tax=Rhizobium rhizogenes TaxID=359 RepID=UPI001A9C51B9|nr:hypothetical protein [Rhizobium rhizogenes]
MPGATPHTTEVNVTSFELKSKVQASSFSQWLDGRVAPFFSTNAGTAQIAFQSWRHFKEAFAPELIGQAVEETGRALGRPIQSCIDPFGGSGTTALACQFLGVRCSTIEVNPYLADLIEAKVASYDIDALIRDFSQVVKGSGRTFRNPFPHAPPTFVEPGVKGRYLFNMSAACRIRTLLDNIEAVGDHNNRRLLRVLLGAKALELSNVVVSGKGRRYKRAWQLSQANANDVVELFSGSVLQAIYEIRRYGDRPSKQYELIRGDSREMIPKAGEFDLSVFSPPYPNSFDYTDVYNVELWVCGYLKSSEANKKLRQSTLRSHVQVSRDYGGPQLSSPTLDEVKRNLRDVKNSLWDPNIPSMVEAYFCDMSVIMDRLRRIIVPSGRIFMVVGDSRYAGVDVPVSRVLQELAHTMDLSVVKEEPFRSMRTSPQQGGRPELLETLITLSRN